MMLVMLGDSVIPNAFEISVMARNGMPMLIAKVETGLRCSILSNPSSQSGCMMGAGPGDGSHAGFG